ncbi:MAG: AAA family ATPase [Gammaproteobacteria bacterium]|nr:AAA family ATPase [Gammaproteobacteria bacterium]MCH9745082.1 AAA family ATPase [Gammaproteobacteria bacterium]
MFKRLFKLPEDLQQSVFIFGPRGTGKTSWLKAHFAEALYFDLLHDDSYRMLLARPSRLETLIPSDYKDWVIIDEIQKIPELLNEVHRLIESRKLKFILTGSSARKLKRKGTNLLAGRALIFNMHPLTAMELGDEFNLKKSLMIGELPTAYTSTTPVKYLQSYIKTYLREEVLEESLVRNIAQFNHFLEAASFSQGEVINYTEISREISSNRHTVTNYFDIIEDLLIGCRLPVFSKKAKRKLISHSKFYYFDVGVYRTIRPQGPLDSNADIDGPALETLFLQEVKAINDYFELGYQFFYWRTLNQVEVDFILYGEKGLLAFEIKRREKINKNDLKGLLLFKKDYPVAKCFMLYGGQDVYTDHDIQIIPIHVFLKSILDFIA